MVSQFNEKVHMDRLSLLQSRLDADNERYQQVSQRRQALTEEQNRLKSIYRNYHSSADWSTADQAFVARALGKSIFLLRIEISVNSANNSGAKLQALDTEFEALQVKIIKQQSDISELNTTISKLQSAPNSHIGTSMGHQSFYSEPKTPNQLIQDIISHVNDFNRVRYAYFLKKLIVTELFSFHYCRETVEELIHCCTVMNRMSPSDQWARDIAHHESLYRSLKQLKRERTDSVTHKSNVTRFELIKTMVKFLFYSFGLIFTLVTSYANSKAPTRSPSEIERIPSSRYPGD